MSVKLLGRMRAAELGVILEISSQCSLEYLQLLQHSDYSNTWGDENLSSGLVRPTGFSTFCEKQNQLLPIVFCPAELR